MEIVTVSYSWQMGKIEHVSDTALMVAAFRAIENDRPDGLIRDPFASVLAGDKGMAIARGASAFEWMSFGVGGRTRFIDDLVLCVVNGNSVRTVVNLGAGLDTRPWRMDLPQDLRWIEVDFPAMLDYKASRLADHQPRCRIERIAADLSNPEERERIFEAVGKSPSLMIAEGLLMYLSRQTVTALASEPADQTGVYWWIVDISAIALMRSTHGDVVQAIEAVRAQDHLEAREILNVIFAHGWKTDVFRSYIRDVPALSWERVAKIMESNPVPADQSPPSDDPSGVYLLERSPANA
jgi:methyltransferase (TIGR00027 family)